MFHSSVVYRSPISPLLLFVFVFRQLPSATSQKLCLCLHYTCIGSNVIPANVFPSKVTPTLLEELVLMAKESNQNMLRVWGGGMYPLDSFYEATDANGIMVWQESMFACAMYPANDAFLREVCSVISNSFHRARI